MDLRAQYRELLELRQKVARAEYNKATDALVEFDHPETKSEIAIRTFTELRGMYGWSVPSWLRDKRAPTIPLFMDEYPMADAKDKQQLAKMFLRNDKERKKMIKALALARPGKSAKVK